VDVDLRSGDLFPKGRDWIVRVVREVLVAEDAQAGAISVVIGDDKLLQDLNRDYRGTDAPTDVLAFSMAEGAGFPTADETPPVLGDVIVSWVRARAQACERGVEPREEMALLLVHGCLHLLGYDHATEGERAAMWARQEAIVALVLRPDGETGAS